ncbi:crotonase/enoyl-CoA hydratase family protein [Sphingomonas sp. RB3P16]|uniref:crotonase/enoyl-CoA hydratase family protein n=1 Tax=Parasphingomonas frigoris TaxID=3096163 RepID=UPI002FCC1D0F
MTIRISDAGPVRTITIDRPERRNAVDPETAVALRAAFTAFAVDDNMAVAVLTGTGGTFCAGFDLTRVESGPPYEPEGPGPMGPTRMLIDKPVIAAIEGHAVAGGLELALWCDLRVASRSAIFGVFCRRWGVPLIDGGTVRLPRIVGQGRALDMILTGRPVAADEALAIGLANRLVEAGSALAEAQELAATIAAFPALCMKADRMSAYCQWDESIEGALRFESRQGAAPLRDEAATGAARFTAGTGRGGSFD